MRALCLRRLSAATCNSMQRGALSSSNRANYSRTMAPRPATRTSPTKRSRGQLGLRGDIEGEYCVRLFLEHSHPAGMLTLPVVDTGNLAGAVVAPLVTEIGKIRVKVEAEEGSAGQVKLRARTGRTPIPNK